MSGGTKRLIKIIAFAIAGLGLMIAGIIRLTDNDRFLARSSHTTGVIERVDKTYSRARVGARYAFRRPYVRFWTDTGKVIEFEGPAIPEAEATFHEGQSIEVAYLPYPPYEARVPSLHFEEKDGSWLLISGVVISTLTGLYVYFKRTS